MYISAFRIRNKLEGYFFSTTVKLIIGRFRIGEYSIEIKSSFFFSRLVYSCREVCLESTLIAKFLFHLDLLDVSLVFDLLIFDLC